MGQVLESISTELAEWMGRQPAFFVATAPSSLEGHVNLSPKGGDAFRVVGPLEVVYQDYTGSGAETAAHLRDNGRIVVMFVAFEGAPKIVRLHGIGTVVEPGDARYEENLKAFPPHPGTRAFVHIAVQRVADSCGFGMPRFELQGPRDTLERWAENQGPEGLVAYREKKNRKSIDGLPALES